MKRSISALTRIPHHQKCVVCAEAAHNYTTLFRRWSCSISFTCAGADASIQKETFNQNVTALFLTSFHLIFVSGTPYPFSLQIIIIICNLLSPRVKSRGQISFTLSQIMSQETANLFQSTLFAYKLTTAVFSFCQQAIIFQRRQH